MDGKIFNIGFNKSGTTSLTEALNVLNYKSIHYRYKEELIKDIMEKNKQNELPLLSGIDEIIGFSDFGGNEYFRLLDLQYPNSKFIVTIRPLQGWLASRAKHIKKNMKNEDYNSDFETIKREKWIQDRKKYIDSVNLHFKGRNNLIYFNIFKGDGWKKLCKFLDCSVPDVDFPYKNKRNYQKNSETNIR